MTALTAWLERCPPALLYALAGLVQVGLIALMLYDRVQILRTGVDVTLQTEPVDPRDLLRGDYVTLTYAMSRMAAGKLAGQPVEQRQRPVYVTLTPNADGFHRPTAIAVEPVAVAPGEVLLRGRIRDGEHCGDGGKVYCTTLSITYGLERYFVPEGEGRELEKARNQRRLSVVAAVTASGRSAIKRLLLEGKPVYDEPLF